MLRIGGSSSVFDELGDWILVQVSVFLYVIRGCCEPTKSVLIHWFEVWLNGSIWLLGIEN